MWNELFRFLKIIRVEHSLESIQLHFASIKFNYLADSDLNHEDRKELLDYNEDISYFFEIVFSEKNLKEAMNYFKILNIFQKDYIYQYCRLLYFKYHHHEIQDEEKIFYPMYNQDDTVRKYIN